MKCQRKELVALAKATTIARCRRTFASGAAALVQRRYALVRLKPDTTTIILVVRDS